MRTTTVREGTREAAKAFTHDDEHVPFCFWEKNDPIRTRTSSYLRRTRVRESRYYTWTYVHNILPRPSVESFDIIVVVVSIVIITVIFVFFNYFFPIVSSDPEGVAETLTRRKLNFTLWRRARVQKTHCTSASIISAGYDRQRARIVRTLRRGCDYNFCSLFYCEIETSKRNEDYPSVITAFFEAIDSKAKRKKTIN